MRYSIRPEAEEFRPRLIVWQLTPPAAEEERTNGNSREVLTPNERHLILEGIARAAKPIVVLTGDHLPQRSDIFELVQYGIAIGLKMIVEAKPEDFASETLRRYAPFGPRIFRVMIDGAIRPGEAARYDQAGSFQALEETVKLLRSSGFEIHLSAAIDHPDIRQLALEHDYAFRRSASGFYCHLAIPEMGSGGKPGQEGEDEIDSYIDAVASLKQFCPENMYYLSPQCVKYGYKPIGDEPVAASGWEEEGAVHEWRHWCLGGKSFAFITDDGIVKICSQLPADDGDLRKNGYDFKKIWETSDTFRILREGVHTCSETQELSKAAPAHEARRASR
jgi:MoaA/NifB/PqqE/SkfB family radical SAM enzyme